jgi:hypothetical protein
MAAAWWPLFNGQQQGQLIIKVHRGFDKPPQVVKDVGAWRRRPEGVRSQAE